jgi:ferric-dicitrate binding protein FerR (iron transport regulator)
MDSKQAKALLEKYRNGQCTPEEKQIVEQWHAELVETGEWQWADGQKEQVRLRMETRLLEQINEPGNKPVHHIHWLRTARWWAAASLLLLLGAGVYFFFFTKKKEVNVASLSQPERFKNDISPANQQVILTLPDGTTRVLDSVLNGALTLQGMQAIKKDGSLTYTANKEVVYNTIATEKGRIFHLQLADGTHVWLDALSSIRFPTSFPAGARVVEVTGQAYFEVASLPPAPSSGGGGKKRSFIVNILPQQGGRRTSVEVLGTHFNINSYDRQNIETTLLEGSVKVVNDQWSMDNRKKSGQKRETAILKPGEQVSLSQSRSSHLSQPIPVQTDEVMAWKNGRFQFSGNNVHQIMDQLARWYNIEVVYKDTITESFVADIKRDLPVSQLLTLLEMTKQIKFEIEGNKVTVMKW